MYLYRAASYPRVSANLKNSTFTKNSASAGGAIFSNAQFDFNAVTYTLVISNCTFRNNTVTADGGGKFLFILFYFHFIFLLIYFHFIFDLKMKIFLFCYFDFNF